MTLTQFFDFFAVIIFALTGALAASRAQLDIFGFIFFATLTAVGGGTLRDVLLNVAPVFWIASPTPLFLAAGAAALVFFTAHLMESRYAWLIWLDALALSVAVSAGVSVALEQQQAWPIVLLMGVVTGTFGGLMRDVVANEVPLLLKKGEMYATAAFFGAASCIPALYLFGSLLPALATVALVTFALRAGRLAFGWHLPVYKSRPATQGR